jgi:predicted small lipoprotein YifL
MHDTKVSSKCIDPSLSLCNERATKLQNERRWVYQRRPLMRFFWIAVSIFFLTACGMKGPLYLPQDKTGTHRVQSSVPDLVKEHSANGNTLTDGSS